MFSILSNKYNWNVFPSSLDRQFVAFVYKPQIGDIISHSDKEYRITDVDYNSKTIYTTPGRYTLSGNDIQIR